MEMKLVVDLLGGKNKWMRIAITLERKDAKFDILEAEIR